MKGDIKIYQELIDWKANPKIEEGIALHYKYSKIYANKKKIALCKTNKKSMLTAFINELIETYKPSDIKIESIKKEETKPVIVSKTIESKLKDEFPKLDFNTLPENIKQLVIRRYNSWLESKKYYQFQQEAKTETERFEAAKQTVLAIMDNWSIWEELDHFHKYGKPIGKHEIFSQNEFVEELGKLKQLPPIQYTKELYLILRRGQNNLNRILNIKSKTGKLTERQIEVYREWIYKYNTVAEILKEPLWKKEEH